MIDDIKAILFDLDDTLYDREEAQREVILLIAREFPGLFAGIDSERIVNAFFESDRVSTQEFDAGSSVDSTRAVRGRIFLKILGLSEKFAEKIIAMYVELCPTVNLSVDGATSMISNLARRFQLGIVSNGSPDMQYRKLETLGIKGLFDCIMLSEEINIRKPDPRIFWRAANLLNRKPEECLYIGDSYDADVVGAKKAGMLACWFNPHGLNRPEMDIKPDFEIGTLVEILEFLLATD